MDDGENLLWARYRLATDDAEQVEMRNNLVELYLPLARGLSIRYASRTPAHILADDLFGEACQGLLESIPRFEPSLGHAPVTFFYRRIVGAMIDYIRRQDHMTKRDRKKLSMVTRWQQNELGGREASSEEIRAQFGFDPAEARSMGSLDACYGGSSKPMIDTLTTGPSRPPSLGGGELSIMLRGCTTRERLLVVMYYIEGNTMGEIGETLAVSESRVSKILTALLTRLRAAALRDSGETYAR